MGFGGLCSVHNWRTSLEILPTAVLQLLRGSLLAIKTVSVFIHVYVRATRTWRNAILMPKFPFHVNNGCSDFQCIHAGVGLSSVTGVWFLCSKSRPKPDFLILASAQSQKGWKMSGIEIPNQTSAVKKTDYLTYTFKFTPLRNRLIRSCHFRCISWEQSNFNSWDFFLLNSL